MYGPSVPVFLTPFQDGRGKPASGPLDGACFDNLMSLVVGDMKEEDAWRDTMPLILELTKRQIGQLWVHHTGHDASQIPNPTEGIGNRHVKGAAILGFDSRVHWISRLKFDQEASRFPGLLWCVPGSPTGQ